MINRKEVNASTERVSTHYGGGSASSGVVLLPAHGSGHCAGILASSTSTHWAQRFLNWHGNSKRVTVVEGTLGFLILPRGGFLLAYSVP